jgi:cytochrome c biogenesis protein CcmG/thiol:disulfide interchange protein DsbE
LKRNSLVLGITLLILAIFAWAGWANWEFRKQAAERRAAQQQVQLIPASSTDGDAMLTTSKLVDHPAPSFALEDLNGRKVGLSDYKGKAVLINFWATWCGPCKIETPWLVDLRNKYAAQGFEVLGIDAENDEVTPSDKQGWQKNKAEVAKFVQQMKMPYPVLLGGDSLDKTYGGLEAMPTSFYVDRKGTVIAMRMGITSKDEMETQIKKTLGAAQ